MKADVLSVCTIRIISGGNLNQFNHYMQLFNSQLNIVHFHSYFTQNL